MGQESNAQIIINALDLALQYGIPLVKQAIQDTGKTVITQEDIDNLHIPFKDDPDNWFE